jgi:hypothetical protein
VKLWFYNNVRRPIQNALFWVRYRKEWIAQGRDPKQFPRAGRLTQEDLDWADEVSRRR